MVTDAVVREGWRRAEAFCECREPGHGHGNRCHQFLIWNERGETSKGAWEAEPLQDPRHPACVILCAACYVKVTGRVPKGPS